MADMVIWDRFIRCYHWFIVVAFVLNYFVLEPGEQVHQWLGYSVVTLVLLRLLWGLVGPPRARISSFFPSRVRLSRHLQQLRERQLPQHEGHNPLGGLMIITLWSLLIGQGVTGFLLVETHRFYGNSELEAVHAWFAHVIYACILVHVAAVLVIGWWGKIALIRPMITGTRER